MEHSLTRIAIFAALIAALGLMPKLALGFGVPITAQSLGVMLCGTVLGARRGMLAVLLFLLLVAIGLPLLSGGRGGIGAFFTPAAGFIVGWPVAAFVAGLWMERVAPRPTALHGFLAASLGGIVVLYAFGIIGMSVALGISPWQALILTAAFIPGDLIKAAVAGMITAALWRARPGLFPRSPAAPAMGSPGTWEQRQ